MERGQFWPCWTSAYHADGCHSLYSIGFLIFSSVFPFLFFVIVSSLHSSSLPSLSISHTLAKNLSWQRSHGVTYLLPVTSSSFMKRLYLYTYVDFSSLHLLCLFTCISVLDACFVYIPVKDSNYCIIVTLFSDLFSSTTVPMNRINMTSRPSLS